MTTILYDIALIKSSKANFFDYFNNSGISPEEYLCYKYNVDQIMLEENISYYSYEPENIKKIYQSIKDSLERKEKYLEQIVENKKALLLAQQREEDSLMNAELIKDTIKDSIQ